MLLLVSFNKAFSSIGLPLFFEFINKDHNIYNYYRKNTSFYHYNMSFLQIKEH